MVDEMQFDLVTPERKLASVKATEVQIPGADGDMTVMVGHMPVITTLRPGVLRVTDVSGTGEEYAVTGGFAEVTAGSASVLAEQALPKDAVSADFLSVQMKAAQAARDGAAGADRDAADKWLVDLLALADAIGILLR